MRSALAKIFGARGVNSSILANIGTRILSAALTYACIPIFVRVLGAQNYGIIALYFTIQSVFSLLDLGLGTTITRELAKVQLVAGERLGLRDFVRTLEIMYWMIGIAAGLALVLSAEPIAVHWLRYSRTDSLLVIRSVRQMGLAFLFSWPINFYIAGLNGLHRQVLSSLLQFVLAVLRYLGAAIALRLFGPSLTVFFGAQLLAGFIVCFAVAAVLNFQLPGRVFDGRFRSAALKGRLGFVSGMSAVYVMIIVYMQLDKVVLSRWLPLSQYSSYMLAWSAVQAFYLFYSPIITAIFPQLCGFLSTGEKDKAGVLYKYGCELTGALVWPTAVVLTVFSSQIMLLWLKNATLAAEVAPLVNVLAGTCAFGAVAYLPMATQWASGWTTLSFWAYLCGSLVLAPLLWISTRELGMLGAVLAWSVVRIIQCIVLVEGTHSRVLLPKDRWSWYVFSNVLPITAAMAVSFSGQALISGSGLHFGYLSGAGIWLTAMLASALLVPATRRLARETFGQLACAIRPLQPQE